MKNMQLHIDSPCQENWAAMTPEGQGRFCASCSKTVVDFTAMSDREVMAYFQNRKGEVCGRFYNDQLNRPILPERPGSRIPNLLFRYTWPAFVLFLKSCTDPGRQGQMLGDIAVRKVPEAPPVAGGIRASYVDSLRLDQPTLLEYLGLEQAGSFRTLGFVSPMIVEDSARKPETPAGLPDERQLVIGDTVSTEGASCTLPEDTTAKAMDTVTVIAYPTTRMGKLAMGSVSTVKQETLAAPILLQPLNQTNSASMHVFPNPVAPGGLLTVSFDEEGQMPRGVELYSISGARVLSVQQPEGMEATVFNLRIPSQLAAGTYILRLSHPGWKSVVSQKIIIQ